MRLFRKLRALALACCVLPSGWADASGVRISPVVIELPTARQPAVLSVTNESDAPRTFQGQALLWRQEGGRDIFEETSDLLVVPAIAEIPAGGTQLFRVALRQPAGAPRERTYRLVLEDISIDPATGRTVAFRYAHNLPLMVAPEGRIVQAARWRACSLPPEMANAVGRACVRILNAGNRRLKIERLQVQAGAAAGRLELPQAVNILAGATRDFIVELSPPAAGNLASVRIDAPDAPNLPTEHGDF